MYFTNSIIPNVNAYTFYVNVITANVPNIPLHAISVFILLIFYFIIYVYILFMFFNIHKYTKDSSLLQAKQCKFVYT